MKDSPKPDKRRTYDAAFRAKALRLVEQSRSAQAAARVLNIDPKRIYQWQKAAQTPVAAALGPPWTRPRPPSCANCRPWPGGRRRSWPFKKSHCHLLADRDAMSRYRFIAAECGHYPVQRLCQVLGVPASGYYAWQAAQQRAVGRPAAGLGNGAGPGLWRA
ncbi:transposase [Hymenobacter arizonensis]|uniref:transposase n=1 Tax=Hymenobacter arizonensis TaxID=1227077 RepID=UPI000B838BD3|nr:transposase [Hymenobacter arizonensis]